MIPIDTTILEANHRGKVKEDKLMKIKTILSFIIIGVAAAFIYQGVDQKDLRVTAQVGGGCSSYDLRTDECGDSTT